MSRAEKVKSEAEGVAPSSDYLTFIPKVIGIVQSHYKKEVSSKDKKKMVIALVKELFPKAYSDETIISEIIDLTFWLCRNNELRKLLKKSCSCF
jgi:hypothetical protein